MPQLLLLLRQALEEAARDDILNSNQARIAVGAVIDDALPHLIVGAAAVVVRLNLQGVRQLLRALSFRADSAIMNDALLPFIFTAGAALLRLHLQDMTGRSLKWQQASNKKGQMVALMLHLCSGLQNLECCSSPPARMPLGQAGRRWQTCRDMSSA